MKKLLSLVFFLCLTFGFSQTKDIDSLTLELAFQNQDSVKVDTSIELIKKLYNANELGRAIEFINQTEKLATDLGYDSGLAEITYYKALVYDKKEDYINAINTFKKSQQLYLKSHDTINVARIYGNLGLVEIKRGNYQDGLKYSLIATKELEKRNLRTELSKNYKNLAQAYLNTRDYDRAIEYNLKTLYLEEQSGLKNESTIYDVYKDLALLYAYKNENRKALEYYGKLVDNGVTLTDEERASILPLMANEYFKLNNLDKATQLYTESLQLSKQLNNTLGTITALNGLAKVNLKNFNTLSLKQADYQINEALRLTESIDENETVLESYRLRMELDSVKGQFQSAYQWQQKYFLLKERLNDESHAKEEIINNPLDEVEVPSIEELNKPQVQEQDTETDKSFFTLKSKYKILLYGLLAAFIISLAALIFVLTRKNGTAKNHEELEEENKKLELQKEAILEQTKHLEEVNKVKDKLFSIVSHDLKDSLTSINGFIDLLRDGSLSRQEFERLIPELSENANSASLLLFNLLNWSKSQMQSLDPNPSLFDVQEVFETKIKLIDQRAESKGISIIDHTLRDFVYADKSMIEIVVQNLLANAVKFTKAGDTITVSNHISNGTAIISVADTGVGIAKENLDKLFKANSMTTLGTKNEKGTGLGLSICKELVDLNNGKIWVESTLNVGTTFYVQLPKSKPN